MTEFHDTNRDRTNTPPAADAPEYRTPARYPVGEATVLIRRDGSPGYRDGTGGWYVWMSR